MEARKGHQLHLCGDGAQDARGRSVFLTTAEFGGGKSQIVDVSFPVSSLNHKSLGEMNAKIMLELGGSKKIDSYHHDAVAYGFKWGNETLANTFTIFLTDVCHRFDGILDAMIESCPAVEKIISCCNSLFKSTNRAQVSDFKSFIELKGYQFKQYPSPGQIRAWTGDYRVLEWLFLYYELLVSYINETFHLVKNPSEKLVELKDFCRNDSESGDFKIVLAWFLLYTADIVTPIMELQSRTIPTVHKVFDIILGLLDFMNYSNDELKQRDTFFGRVLMSNDLLLKAYKNSRDKSWVKSGLINAIGAGRVQLLKNFGSFERAIHDDCWTLEISDNGDCVTPSKFLFMPSAVSLTQKTESFRCLHQWRSLKMVSLGILRKTI
jgi:hypothetical protein